MAKFCLGCLTPLLDGEDTCRVCGFTDNFKNPLGSLPINTVLQEHYVIGRMVHETGDSLSYLGYDKTLGEPCFIQEFYPGGLCARSAENALTPLAGCGSLYAGYMQSFTKTMRSLARVKDLPCVIPIYDIFEQNGTVYAVSDYIAGETLAHKLNRIGRISWQGSRTLFMSLLTCVEQLASAGISHNAICPANILIADNGKPYLRSYSIASTRQIGCDLTPHLATGYAAPEQYIAGASLTEATDVYGLAATIFRTVTGNVPPAGDNRADDSDDLFMTAEIAEELTQQVCVALFNALQKQADARTATVKQLHQQLSMEPNVSALLDEDKPKPEKKKMRPALTLLIIFASVTVALLLALGVVLYLLNLGDEGDSSDESTSPSITTTSTTESTTTTTTSEKKQQYKVPDYVKKPYYDVLAQNDGKFEIEVVIQPSDESLGKDIIYKQEPAAGENLEEGSKIKVYIDNQIVLPDVAGMDEQTATLILQNHGFKVVVNKVYSEQPAGWVDRTDPKAGTKLSPGATVTLKVSEEKQSSESTNPSTTE